MNKKAGVKIAYIGGGSRGWARTFMYDLAVQNSFEGEVRLYDIDREASEINKILGNRVSEDARAVSKWRYEVANTLDEALKDADFVMLSIMPGTFDEMESDVHAPEAYGIYQSVGDTVGPGGLLRAMRTLPMYETFAEAIKRNCPNAFVINFTNPMTLCTRVLYDVFPEIKAFGCCHEVFGTQSFLADVVMEITGEKNVKRQEIKTDVQGINHFTWFTKAECRGMDLFPIYKEYTEKHIGDVICKEATQNPYKSTNLVKLDLFRRFGQIAAAGDRHLAEFVNGAWYLKDPETVKKYGFALTSVDWRRGDLALRYRQTEDLLSGKDPLLIEKSNEEFVELMEGLVGMKDFISNVNLPNHGQVPFAPENAVVETNATFTKGKVTPCVSQPLFQGIQPLVLRQIHQQENALRAIRKRDIQQMFNVFIQEPSCSRLSLSEAEELFGKMVKNTATYLPDWQL
ncbi:MAG: alpha-glucosidase/alpha-galactosidase [Clostridia bacterium]|nr:alpha-glucosidase/alpha-galactosidase [Clostridia bacterium]